MRPKVGFFVFSNLDRIRSFEQAKYFGLKSIIMESSYPMAPISSYNIDDYDYCLISITSFKDIPRVWQEIPINRKCKTIIGGAGVYNIWSLYHWADYVVFGRAEGGIVDRIINGEMTDDDKEYVWAKKDDPNIEKTYKMRPPQRLLTLGNWEERMVGCPKKCFFCLYSWKTKFMTRKNSGKYSSGYNEFEDFFSNLNWDKEGGGYLTTALDGSDEKTRTIVNKPISNEEIEAKLMDAYNMQHSKRNVKLYNIIGYPWETQVNKEFLDIVRKVDKKSGKKITFFINFTHFVPCALTPMENEGLNFIDFRRKLTYERYEYNGETFRVILPTSGITSPASALETLISFRINNADELNFISKILISKKWQGLSTREKLKVAKKFFPKHFWAETEIILPYLERQKGYTKAKQKYKKMKKEFFGK